MCSPLHRFVLHTALSSLLCGKYESAMSVHCAVFTIMFFYYVSTTASIFVLTLTDWYRWHHLNLLASNTLLILQEVVFTRIQVDKVWSFMRLLFIWLGAAVRPYGGNGIIFTSVRNFRKTAWQGDAQTPVWWVLKITPSNIPFLSLSMISILNKALSGRNHGSMSSAHSSSRSGWYLRGHWNSLQAIAPSVRMNKVVKWIIYLLFQSSFVGWAGHSVVREFTVGFSIVKQSGAFLLIASSYFHCCSPAVKWLTHVPVIAIVRFRSFCIAQENWTAIDEKCSFLSRVLLFKRSLSGTG